ncbi:MAG: flagellar motor switch protein FliN [Sphingobium sp.]
MSDMSEAPKMESAIGKMNGSSQYHLLSSIPVRLTVEVGATSLRLSEIMDLTEGSVVELDRQADDLLDIMVNGALIARGEVVTVGGRYGIRVVDVASTEAVMAGVERRG